MAYYLIKIAITTVLIVLISEISKRQSFAGSLLASLPIISIFAMFWLYFDTKDIDKVSQLSTSVFWLVLPSLVLFVVLPILLRQGLSFYSSMAASMAITAACYFLLVATLNAFGIKL